MKIDMVRRLLFPVQPGLHLRQFPFTKNIAKLGWNDESRLALRDLHFDPNTPSQTSLFDD